MTGFGDRAAEADGGHHVLQRAALAHVHVDVAGGDQREFVCARRALQRFSLAVSLGPR